MDRKKVTLGLNTCQCLFLPVSLANEIFLGLKAQ